MKKFLGLFLALAMVLLAMVGCSKSGTPAKTETPAAAGNSTAAPTNAKDDKFLVGVAFGAYDLTPQLLYKEMEVIFKDKGWEYSMTNADQDPSKLLSDVESLCQLKCDVIIVRGITDDTMPPIIEACDQAGLTLICLAVGYEAMADKYITLCSDTLAAGADLLAQWFRDYIAANPGEYNVGYVVGDYSYEAALCRWTAVRDLNTEAKEAVNGEGNWVASDAMSLVEDWLQTYPEMNVICSASDEMSVGIIQALQDAGKNPDDYLLMSFDGLDLMQEYISAGWCDASVAIDFKRQAESISDVCNMVYEDDQAGLDALEPVTPTYSYYMLTTDNIAGIKDGSIAIDYYIY